MWFLEDRPRACQVTIRVHVVLRFSGRRVFLHSGHFASFPFPFFDFRKISVQSALVNPIGRHGLPPDWGVVVNWRQRGTGLCRAMVMVGGLLARMASRLS